MASQQVEIVRLEPMRMVVFHGFGPNPEELAWQQLESWAAGRSFFQKSKDARIFGFNNPNPSDASPNYGYDLWLTVGEEIDVEAPIRIHRYPGGLYAVMHLENITAPWDQIPQAWHNLYLWVEASRYKIDGELCLEEDFRRPGVTPEGWWEMDLYLPISNDE